MSIKSSALHQRSALVLLVTAMVSLQPAKAALIAYEGFNYTNSTVSGAAGGTGWNGPWTGKDQIVQNSLPRNALVTSGNHCLTTGNSTTSVRLLDTSKSPALISDGRFGAVGTTLWVSFLFRSETVGAQNFAGLSLFDGDAEQLFIGVPTGRSGLTIYSPPTGIFGPTKIVATNQETMLLAVKMSFGIRPDGGTVSFYVDPPPGSEPTNDTYTVASVDGLTFQFDRISISSGMTDTTASFDEIRLGETFEDVMPLASDRFVFSNVASLPADLSQSSTLNNGLVEDTAGNLYGTIDVGGSKHSGVIFRMFKDGSKLLRLHEFDSTNRGEIEPGALMLASDGMLYGGASQGGTGGANGNGGALFRLTSDGTQYQVLRQLDSKADGSGFNGPLLEDADGVLFGVLSAGGAADAAGGGRGTIFRMNKDGSSFKVLHVFIDPLVVSSSTDGAFPSAGLIEGPDHFLYGTTQNGGVARDRGTVFKIAKDGSGYQTIWSFKNDDQGSNPQGRLLWASDGYLYGNTLLNSPVGGAVVFRLRPDGSDFRALRSLPGPQNNASSALVELPDGALYSVNSSAGDNINAYGSIFRIGKDGKDLESLHNFLVSDSTNGIGPVNLFLSKDGALYGLTTKGGDNNAGTLFKMSSGSPIEAPVTLSALGISGNILKFELSGRPQNQYNVQASDYLLGPWQRMNTVQTDQSGHVQFSEGFSTNFTARFYRVQN